MSNEARFCALMSRAIFEAPMTHARVVVDGRDGQRDVDQAAVLALAHRFELRHRAAGADRLEDGILGPAGRPGRSSGLFSSGPIASSAG